MTAILVLLENLNPLELNIIREQCEKRLKN